jgi:two-component system, NtrC family, sensor kinase
LEEGTYPPMGALGSEADFRERFLVDALRYHSLAEHLREVLFHLDGAGHFTFLGAAWKQLTGQDVEDALGQSLLERVHPEDRARVGPLLESLEARERSAFQAELRLLGSSGTVWVALDAHRSLAGEGEVLGTLTDLTERRQLQARLRMADRMATVGMLVPSLVHEMNNPLAFLLANLDYLQAMMEGGDAGPEQLAQWREAVGDMREGAERLRQLVGNLRGLRGEGGPGLVDLDRVLDSVGMMVSSTLRSRARLVKDYGTRAAVAGGENTLRQVFLNLALHAALSIPEGAPQEHELRLVLREGGAGRVVVEVRDTGAGIAPEHLPHVFDPLFTPPLTETGLGPSLSVCHELVRGLGGDITVSSSPGRGSVFQVTLPVAG